MPSRRVVALAQALTMILLLFAPGPQSVGPVPVRAARAPASEPTAVNVFDAAGKGIGCQAGTRKYKGPGLPKDPPWPPGSKPTPAPTPVPTPEPSPEASPSDTVSTPITTDEPEDAASLAFLAAEVEVPEVEPPAAPTKKVRKSKLMKGLDVSHWQEGVDYRVAREAGNRFVFIKATESHEFVDSWLAANLEAASAAGLAVGAYHVFDYTHDGADQADHFIDRLERAGGIDRSLPPVIDVECWDYRGSSNQVVSATRLRDLVDRIYERIGRLPLIYTSSYMWSQVVGDSEDFGDLPLWAACWRCDVPPTLPAGWDDWVFWQIGQFRIPGAAPDAVSPNRLDGNYFRGKKKDLDALKLRPFSIAGGKVADAGGRVQLDLGGRDATHLRTSPDGTTWSDWEPIRSVPTAHIPSVEGEHTIYVQLRNGRRLRSPVFSDSVFVDATPPELSTPALALRLGPLEGPDASIPISVTWDAIDAHAGLVDATVAVSCADGQTSGDGQTSRSDAPGSAAPGKMANWDAAAVLFPDATCEVTAIAPDGAGNRARAGADPVVASTVPINPGQPATADVSGAQVGIIARRGPDRGRASVSIDDEAVGLVDLYAPVATGPELVYIADLEGAAQVSVEPTGTADPASTGTDIAIDAFVSLAPGR